jgi:Ni,Fe-hydrogenase I large subunit
MAAPYAVPAEALGVGFWEAGRGTLTHHLVVEGGRIANYQIITPSTLNASPQDPWDQPGPYEQAVMNTPILEDVSDPERFTSGGHAQGHPQLRPMHALHDARRHGPRNGRPRGEHVRMRNGLIGAGPPHSRWASPPR